MLRDGDGIRRIVDLADAPERLTIGRSAASDVALAWDGGVSRVHASLERLGEEWTLVDDGRSRNGSSVDGEPLRRRRRLRDGDVVLVERTTLVFRRPTGRESLRTLPSQLTVAPFRRRSAGTRGLRVPKRRARLTLSCRSTSIVAPTAAPST